MRSDEDDDALLISRGLTSRADEGRLHRRLLIFIRVEVRRATRGGAIGPWDAEDLVQHVSARLWQDDAAALRKYDSSRGRLGTFVCRFTRSRLQEVWRKELRRQVLVPATEPLAEDLEDPAASPETQALTADLFDRLLSCLRERLGSDRARQMIDAFYVRWLGPEAIASETGMDRQAVFRWQSRVRAAARACLETLQASISRETGRATTPSPRREE